MNILPDGTVLIEHKEEMALVKKYVDGLNLKSFKLKIAYNRGGKIVQSKLENGIEFFKEYADVLSRAECVDLTSAPPSYLAVTYYSKYIKKLVLPTLPEEEYDNIQPFIDYLENLEILDYWDIKLFKSNLNFNNIKQINIKGRTNSGRFAIDDANGLTSIDAKDFEKAKNLTDFEMMTCSGVYSFCMSNPNVKNLRLIGNYNLKIVELPQDLGGLESLTIYTNNDECNFDAVKIAEIIRASYKGLNKLKHFAFDLYEYPKVMKILSDDLKDEKFKAHFENLCSVGEYTTGKSVNEISAKRMREIDLQIESIIKQCGVQKNDNDMIAFAKLYLYLIQKYKYNKKSIDNGKDSLVAELSYNYASLKDEYIISKMIGNGYHTATAFGFLSNDMNSICSGISRSFKYMLKKVGIDSILVHSYVDNDEKVAEQNSLNMGIRNANHVILSVEIGDGNIFVDVTGELQFAKCRVGGLLLFNRWKLKGKEYLFTQKYFKNCGNSISASAMGDLIKAFTYVKKCENGKVGVVNAPKLITANNLTGWAMSGTYKTDNKCLFVDDTKYKKFKEENKSKE